MTAAAGALLLLLSLITWALSSPVGSSPDEDYHLGGAWCGLGLRDGLCEETGDPLTRAVPVGIVNPVCFAFAPERSAACQGDTVRSVAAGTELAPTSRGNFTGDYPPVYFAAMGVLAGDDIVTSVMSMRAASAVIFVVLAAAVAVTVPPHLRRAVVGGFAVTAVPLGMFIIPAVNPSSWAVISAVTFLVSLVGYMTAGSRRRRAVNGVLAAVALLIGAGARADAAIYSVVAVCAALVLTVRWERGVLLRALYPVVLAVVAIASFLSAGQSGALDAAPPQELTVVGFGDILLDVPDLWVGALGGWGLGWLDTPMPPVVWALAWGALVAVAFAALSRPGWREGLALLGVGTALAVVPAYLQYLSGHPVGSYIQPRYILPLLVLLAVTALVSADGRRAVVLSGVQRWFLVAALSLANSVALHHNIRRYVTGTDVVALDLDTGAEWWWVLPMSPMVVWAVGTIAFAGALALLSEELVRPPVPTDLDRPEPAREPADGPALTEPPRTEPGRTEADGPGPYGAAEADGPEPDGAAEHKDGAAEEPRRRRDEISGAPSAGAREREVSAPTSAGPQTR